MLSLKKDDRNDTKSSKGNDLCHIIAVSLVSSILPGSQLSKLRGYVDGYTNE